MPLVFKPGIKRNARRVPQPQWNQHKELLCSLYQEKTITELVQIMEDYHDFIATEAQLGKKLREWGVHKYNSKHSLRPQGSVAPSNTVDPDRSGFSTTADTTQQSLSIRQPTTIPKGEPVVATLEQIDDMPEDDWFSSVSRWLDSHEVGARRSFSHSSSASDGIYFHETIQREAIRMTVLKFLCTTIYHTIEYALVRKRPLKAEAGDLIPKIGEAQAWIYGFITMTGEAQAWVNGFITMIRETRAMAYGLTTIIDNFQAVVDMFATNLGEVEATISALSKHLGPIAGEVIFPQKIGGVSTRYSISLDRVRELCGHNVGQLCHCEADRMSLDSASQASLSDLASLSRRIRRTPSSLLFEAQEDARIPPSQVMRRTSVASSSWRLFDGISEISSVSIGSDAMNWEPEGVSG